MTGADAVTGGPLSADAHLAQSVHDILNTPVGTRVMRRDYGSLLPDLIDSAMNPVGAQRIFAAIASAIRRWEPRLRLTRVAIAPQANGGDGAFALSIEGTRTDGAGATDLTLLTIPLRAARAAN